jgi:hypothetical protein
MLPHGAQANLRYLTASENDGESYGMHSIQKSTRDIPRSTQASRAIPGGPPRRRRPRIVMLPRAATAPRCAASFEQRRHRSPCRIPVSFRKFGLASLGRLAAERLYSTVCRRAARARPARLSQLVKSGRRDSGFLDREQSSDETKFWFNRLLSREESFSTWNTARSTVARDIPCRGKRAFDRSHTAEHAWVTCTSTVRGVSPGYMA